MAKLNDMIEGSLAKIRELAETDTVVGSPITTPNGTTIIPVSKVTMGFASGGLDYDGKAAVKGNAAAAQPHFGGGGGTGINVTPIAFLLVTPEGRVEMLPINAPADTMDKIFSMVDKAPDIFSRLTDAVANAIEKKKASKQSKEEASSSADASADPA